MAAEVSERFVSRRRAFGANPYISVLYIVTGTTSDAEAEAAMIADTPSVRDGWARTGIDVDQIGAENVWEGTATYGPGQPVQPRGDEMIFNFSTGGGTTHITQALEHISRTGILQPGGITPTAPDYRGAIGVTDRDVEGIDVVVPRFEWSEEHIFPSDAVSPAFRGRLFDLTGTVNSLAWGDLQAGEGLFLGAEGTRRNGANGPDWSIVYRFAASPNATVANQRIPLKTYPAIPTAYIAKQGWDYLWFRYEDQEDADAGKIVKRPISYYIERVYRRANWGHPTRGLGIPSAAHVPQPWMA